jgi:hypothetical protein
VGRGGNLCAGGVHEHAEVGARGRRREEDAEGMGAAALREGVVVGVEAGARGGAGDLGCGQGVRQGHERASGGGC